MLYPHTTDYYWTRFDQNSSLREMIGGWEEETGFGQGPFSFGSAIKLKDEQCMYDTDWMKPDEGLGLDIDPCMYNPANCTEGISFSIWEQMIFTEDIMLGKDIEKRYLVSTGGDHNPVNGKAWPGFAIFHQGIDIIGMVSTGEKVWTLSVSGQLYNNTWTNIAIRFTIPDLSNPKLAELGEKGLEKMGGLEMFINLEKVGHTILPESTDRGSTTWTPQPRLTDDGTGEGLPVVMFGCHQNYDLQQSNEFTGFAGTNKAPALIDEFSIWKHRLENYEVEYFYGGYNPDFDSVNADQFSAMLGGVDLNDPEQAAAAQAVVEAMLMGPPTTLPPFPTRTRAPTTPAPTTTLSSEELAMLANVTKNNTTPAPILGEDKDALRKGILSKQNIMTSMLGTGAVQEGSDPFDVEGRFSMAVVASALLTSEEDNLKKWNAVEEKPEYEGAPKTVREMEEYMLAWVGSVNISAEKADEHNWRTKYFDSDSDSMRYSTAATDMVLNVDKIPLQPIRDSGEIRITYPDYDSWEWAEAKAKWNNVKDNFTVPTGMFESISGCNNKPITILTGVYNGLTYITPKRKNPVNIRSKKFRIDTKVISVRVKLNADPMEGDVTQVYQCQPDREYMKWNPVKLTLWHNEEAKAKRTLLWHTDEYWEGLEVRHCVWWNERFGNNGAWDDTGCKVTHTDDSKTNCECSYFGSYAVLAELLEAPTQADGAMWVLALKWVGIILGTLLLAGFIGIVFVSVVVGEMFHQIRMWTCLSYMIANILMLLSDIGICDGRHSNMVFSMGLIFFYQAALWWNMCETHATFKGITSGLINGRTSVYHPIAWGMPLICIGFICVTSGDVLGTHPNCFISWEKPPIQIFFLYNIPTFILTFIFTTIILFNLMRVQSHNKDTVMYLRDQVKGMVATSVGMMILWCYGSIGYFSYMKTSDMDVINMMPLFQVLNGWFGVIMFLFLGMWSKRFRRALSSQAEEKRLQAMKYMDDEDEASPSTAQTSPASSRPASAASNRPASAPAVSRPASSTSNPLSRPASSTSKLASRPASSTSKPASRPATSSGSRPASGASKAASRPASGASKAASRPATAAIPEAIPEEVPEVDTEAPQEI